MRASGSMLCALVLAGCGRIAFDPSASAGDAGGDADDGGAIQTATVVARLDGVLLGGVTAFFSDPSGALLHTATTDASGEATADVATGELVTTVVPFTAADGSPYVVLTTTIVNPGERVVLDSGHTDFDTHQVDVDFPAFGGAVDYAVTTSCGSELSTGTTTTLKYRDACQSGATMNIVAVARAADTSSIAWTAVQVPRLASTATLPAWSTTFDQSVSVDIADPPGWADGFAGATYALDGAVATSLIDDVGTTAGTPAMIAVPIVPQLAQEWGLFAGSYNVGTSVVAGEFLRLSTFPASFNVGTDWLAPIVVTRVQTPRTGVIVTAPGSAGVFVRFGYPTTMGDVQWATLIPTARANPYVVPQLPPALAALAPPASPAGTAYGFAIEDENFDSFRMHAFTGSLFNLVLPPTAPRSRVTYMELP